MSQTQDLEGTLWRLEHSQQKQGERAEFYELVISLYRSGQLPEDRLYELMSRYPRFGGFLQQQMGA